MEQLLEFIANHPLLSAGFAATLVLLLWTEVSRRAQGYRILTPGVAVDYINRQGAQVVDLSAPADFAKGHIVDARNLPASRLNDPDKEVTRLLEKPLLLTCKNGQASQSAAATLVKRGAKEVAVLKGGMTQWVADQYPVTRR